mmetsp:Transcript_29725/g.75730  ORF Transcript_29725/g.75730 Transcript_29725/m.75730 type:complete len:209 (-) Transcript_29725:522-1148(-)|eukprot:CAMPEP_0202856904 /NCGR_PEP_ID=MMETSP1391-20130828/18_1 /ASSEMBLY_ACC=CAM_ASM_000867 /TAXON_ID=1034604 /ORGANISM="Chlamydomonas leiostraca, Strain SAG 11-49" /LENGTH=208 /DNA_ID=CAMNT_0049535617 /DNA_START=17 /DNA_END=643 /DNA_ORIENTATION=-
MAALLNKTRLPFATASRPAAPKRAVVVVKAQQQVERPKVANLVQPAVTVAVANVIMAMPAEAAGKLFDFNATLPVMAGQFLLLMVFLDKFWFSPVGKVLDERDALIRSKLGSVMDNTGDVDRLAAEAQEILKTARAEVTAMVNSKKQTKQAELDKQYNDAKAKISREVDSSIAALEKESQAMLAKLDSQVDKISNEVLARVLPSGVRI